MKFAESFKIFRRYRHCDFSHKGSTVFFKFSVFNIESCTGADTAVLAVGKAEEFRLVDLAIKEVNYFFDSINIIV